MKLISTIRDGTQNILSNLSWDIGVDLGSNNTLIYLKERGVVIDEPTMLSRLKKKRWTGLSAPKVNYVTPIAYGYKAKEMLNREPRQLEVVSPIKFGIISDLEAAENIVGYYLKLVAEVPSKYPKILKPRVIVGVPTSITDVQKRAVRSIFLSAGVREVILIEEVVLAAIGLGLPMDRSAGSMIVDIGGGKTEVMIVSMGGVVVGKGIKVAGNDFDNSIINYMKMKYGLLIGQNTAEKAKMEIGGISEELRESKSVILRGRDLATNLPKSIRVTGGEIGEAVAMDVSKIVKLVGEVLDEAPPELMEDILKRGIVLVGNGARIRGIEKLIEAETKISTKLTDDPGLAVIKGIGELIENPATLAMVKLVSGS